MLTHGVQRTTTDDGQMPVTIAHPEHFVINRHHGKQEMSLKKTNGVGLKKRRKYNTS